MHALLRHFEAVGFEGAPRVLGIDEDGREVLSFVEGERGARAGACRGRGRLASSGAFSARMHDAQAGFGLRTTQHWQRWSGAADDRTRSICHNDLFWPNVVFRDGPPVALIDWDLAAARATARTIVASAANYLGCRCARDERCADGWGVPDRPSRRAPARCCCDAYGLERGRARGAARRRRAEATRIGLRAHRRWAADERRARAGARCGIAGSAEQSYGDMRLVRGPPRRAANDGSRDLKPVTVLVSASGAPGTAALLRALRENGERERAPRRHRHVRAGGRPASLRRVPPRPGRLRPGLRRRDARRRRAGGRRRRPAAVVVRPRRARRAPRPLPGAGARLAPGHDPPLERQGRDLRAAAAPRRPGARLPPRQRRAPRSRRPPASSATPTGPSASSRSSPPARAASASSTRPSTARTSSCTSGPGSVAMRLEEAVELLPDEGGPDLLVMELATGGERTIDGIADGGASCSATRRRARRCAPASRCTSSRSRTRS